MAYIVVYDGGGTKTNIAAFDQEGKIYYQGTSKGSNHYTFDGADFDKVIENLFVKLKQTLKIEDKDISYVYLGLSGADLPSDFEKLYEYLTPVFKTVDFYIENDAWAIWRSGLKVPYGLVAISGTGTNAAGMNQFGKKAILRSLGFKLGIYGGGLDIASEGLHYAFRADEYTYHDTKLKHTLPRIFGKRDMADLLDMLYPVNQLTKNDYAKVTKCVHDLANEGDRVSKEILKRIGNFIGYQTAGIAIQLEMIDEKFPVVLGGSVLDSAVKDLKQSMKKTLKKICKNCYFIKNKYPPIIGAYLRALDQLNIKQTEKIDKQLKESWKLYGSQT